MVPTTIEEAAALQHSIGVQCRCGNNATFNAMGVWWKFKRRNWDQRFGPAKARFYCWNCWNTTKSKLHPVKLETVMGTSKTDVLLELPPPHEWRRAMSRVR